MKPPMSFDLYADLADQQACPSKGAIPAGLSSGFVDGCTVFATRGNDDKNEARRRYLQQAAATALRLPEELQLDRRCEVRLFAGWLAVEVPFTLQTPWYSKDDRPFHVLDNPVRKDRVFGVPYMSAASWKGLLRWACRMQAGLREHLEKHDGLLGSWEDPGWIVDLFGNEKGEDSTFQQGALVFYPTWFHRIGFEVINPHSRKTRAGTQPIYYEVVPPNCKGTLRLLYAPLPGQAAREGVDAEAALGMLLEAAEKLLTVYGFSAKRTSGWGLATVGEWSVRGSGGSACGTRVKVTAELGRLLGAAEAKP